MGGVDVAARLSTTRFFSIAFSWAIAFLTKPLLSNRFMNSSPAPQAQRRPAPKRRARQTPVRARVPGPGRIGARRPGGRRKALAVMRRLPMVPSMKSPTIAIRNFWDASLHKTSPPLRTTFGNFATTNLVTRFNIFTSTTLDAILWIPYTPSPMAALYWAADPANNTLCYQHLYKTLAPQTTPGDSVPRQVRPLRQSFRIANITKNINTTGDVFVLSYDNSLTMSFVFGASTATSAYVTSGTSTSLRDLIEDSPETRVYPLTTLNDPHTFVSVPSAWPEYNGYKDFVPYRYSVSENAPLTSGDLYAMAAGDLVPTASLSDSADYPYALATTKTASGCIGQVPAMRGHLLYFPATADVQTLEVEIFRQVGARFASNSVGHTFHHTPAPGTEKTETSLLQSIQHVASDASAGFAKTVIDASAAYTASSNMVKGIAADTTHAVQYLTGALRGLKIM